LPSISDIMSLMKWNYLSCLWYVLWLTMITLSSCIFFIIIYSYVSNEFVSSLSSFIKNSLWKLFSLHVHVLHLKLYFNINLIYLSNNFEFCGGDCHFVLVIQLTTTWLFCIIYVILQHLLKTQLISSIWTLFFLCAGHVTHDFIRCFIQSHTKLLLLYMR